MSLYQHQEDGAQILAKHQHHYLGDEPGTGKTRTLIRALQLARKANPLVLCPAIARDHWWHEFEEMGWSGLQPAILSYDTLVHGGEERREQLLAAHPDALILDEAHVLRTPDAQRTKLVLGREGLARRIPTVWPASGTPMWKTPDNLWTIISALWPDEALRVGCPTATAWRDRFCAWRTVRIGYRIVPKVYGVRDSETLHALLGRIMLRRTVTDLGIDVPPIVWQPWEVGDPGEHVPDAEILEWSAYAHANATLHEIAGRPESARLRRLLGEAKAPIAVKLIDDLLEGSDEKVVVFAYHRNVLGNLCMGLSRHGVAYIDGDTSPAARADAITSFQENAGTRVFVGQITACQTAITLTAAHRVVLVEPAWTAQTNYQAVKRVARITQAAPHCFAHMLTLSDSIDAHIVRQNIREVQYHEEVIAGGARSAGVADDLPPGPALPPM